MREDPERACAESFPEVCRPSEKGSLSKTSSRSHVHLHSRAFNDKVGPAALHYIIITEKCKIYRARLLCRALCLRSDGFRARAWSTRENPPRKFRERAPPRTRLYGKKRTFPSRRTRARFQPVSRLSISTCHRPANSRRNDVPPAFSPFRRDCDSDCQIALLRDDVSQLFPISRATLLHHRRVSARQFPTFGRTSLIRRSQLRSRFTTDYEYCAKPRRGYNLAKFAISILSCSSVHWARARVCACVRACVREYVRVCVL